MDGLDEVTGASRTDVGDAGAVLHLSRHLVHQALDGVVRGFGAAGHHAGTLQSTLGTTGHTHADEAEALALELLHTALGVVVVRVATIDEQITFLEVRGDLVNNSIHSRSCLDHHQDPARTLELADEVLKIRRTLDIPTLSATVEELFRLGVSAVVNNARETVALGIEDEVLAHHAETDQTEVRLGHGLGDH